MQTRELDNLLPYDRNPRVNEDAVLHVLESLKVHGQVKPIVISAIGHPFDQETICCGHTTMLALREYGATSAMVIVHEFKDEKEFVDYNVRDNKTSEFSKWDEDILQNLELDFDLDLNEMGFNLDELEEQVSGEEIDLDELDDSCELKIKMPSDVYDRINDALEKYDSDKLKALMKALNVEA